MINYLIKFSVHHKGFIFFLTGVLIAYGVYSLMKLPIDAVPDISNNQVSINTSVIGWSAEEIEKTITFPIETAVRGIPNAKEVRSLSRLGLSQVNIIFEDNMNIYLARQLVSERLQTISDSLPATPSLGPVTTGLGEVYQYVVEYKDIAEDPEKRLQQLIELKSIQDWDIKPRLAGIPGVAEINTTGGYNRQIHIKPNPKKLASYGMTFTDIENAINNATANVGGGYVEQEAGQFVVQAVGFLTTKEDILNLPVKTLSNMRVISIKDVAEVEEGKAARTGAATYNGRECVLGTIMMMTGENSRTVSERAAEQIAIISKDLPSDVEIIPLYNRSDLVGATINTVWHNVATGAALVIIILFLLVGNLRAAFITAITIPLSLLITVIGMRFFHISGNLMSLGALDFGIIIDGVVIVVDYSMRKIKEKLQDKKYLSPSEIDTIVINATSEIRSAAGFGQLILVIVFLPIFALVGIEAKTFQPMAKTFIIALLGALVLSWTLTPALISVLLRKNHNTKESRIMMFLEKIYQIFIGKVIRKSIIAISFSFATIILSVIMFKNMGAEFLPQLQEGAIAFQMIRPQEVSLSMSVDLQHKAESIILSHPEVESVFTRMGTSDVATDPMGVNVSDTYIMLKDLGRGINVDNFTNTLYEHLNNDLPGMTYLASQPIQMRFNELLEGSRADLTVKIFGPDLAELQRLGEEAEKLLKPISETSDIELDRTGNFPMYTIEPKLEALQKYGVKKSDILDAVALALLGREVGFVYEQDRRFPVVIRLDETERKDIETIGNLPIPIFGNTVVPLKNLAEIKFKDTYAAINRDNGYRRATIMANIRGIDTKTFVEKAQAVLNDKLKLPEGYYIEWGGQYKNLQSATLRFAILIPLTLLAVFFMIYMAFKSFKQTLIIFLGIPSALFGGILSLYIAGIPLSVSAGIGFIALIGIAVLNGMVLIVGYKNHIYDGLSLEERVIKGSTSRLRPVLMTALADILGFIPMAVSTGIGSEVQKPLAVVIIGGIISSTILTLVVLPSVYYRLGKKKKHDYAEA